MSQGESTTAILNKLPGLADRFDVVRVIGEGAAGAVYLVRDRFRDGQTLALKVLRNTSAFDEHTLTRFTEEWRALKDLNHPHIVHAYDLLPLEGTVAFTMEFVEGKDLSQLVRERAVSPDEVVQIGIEVCEALQVLHERDIFHRDIKLENIFWSSDRGIKLGDFGLMKQEGLQKLTRTGILLGTAQYLPPEYVRQSKYDARSELYALGILLYELLRRERWLNEFEGNDAIHYLLVRNFRIPLAFPEGTSTKLKTIIQTLLEPNPDSRFQSALELREALEAPEVPRESSLPYVLRPLDPEPTSCLGRHAILMCAVVFSLSIGSLLYILSLAPDAGLNNQSGQATVLEVPKGNTNEMPKAKVGETAKEKVEQFRAIRGESSPKVKGRKSN